MGDSSAGNAIDAEYFTQLSHLESANLSLTGSWGILGSLGVLQHALRSNKNIQNVIIIQTLDIWKREFSKESILELFTLKDSYKNLDFNTIISHNFNPKEIWWHLKKWGLGEERTTTIEYGYDYVSQKSNRYSNHKREMPKSSSYEHLKISEAKKDEYRMLEAFCKTNTLNCIFIHGPIHSTIAKNSPSYIKRVDNFLLSTSEIDYISTIFAYDNSYIGDSPDHVDVKYKREVTLDYYRALESLLSK